MKLTTFIQNLTFSFILSGTMDKNIGIMIKKTGKGFGTINFIAEKVKILKKLRKGTNMIEVFATLL